MYCPKCGTENADTSDFCSKCGNSLKQEVTSNAEKKKAKISIFNILEILSLIISFALMFVNFSFIEHLRYSNLGDTTVEDKLVNFWNTVFVDINKSTGIIYTHALIVVFVICIFTFIIKSITHKPSVFGIIINSIYSFHLFHIKYYCAKVSSGEGFRTNLLNPNNNIVYNSSLPSVYSIKSFEPRIGLYLILAFATVAAILAFIDFVIKTREKPKNN